MREIKFRAWDGRNKRMIFDFEKEPSGGYLDDCGYLIKYNTWELMQFTGLRDKNGKECYEGDVTKREYEPGKFVTEQIIFKSDAGRFSFYHEYPDGSKGWTSLYSGHKVFPWEIIGNVHENPDLLNHPEK